MTPTRQNLEEPNHSAEAERVLVGLRYAEPSMTWNRRTIGLTQSGAGRLASRRHGTTWNRGTIALRESGGWSVGITPTPNNLEETNHRAEAERVLVGWHHD
jgi:hypothetical protein